MCPARERGATLAELLIAMAVLAVVAAVALPSLSFNDSSKLTLASKETVNAIRFARSEAMRTGQRIVVDTESAPGRLRLLRGGCGSTLGREAVTDPLTRRPYDVDLTQGSLSDGVVLQAKFLVGSVGGSSLVFGPSGSAAEACNLLSGLGGGVVSSASVPENSLVLAYAGKTVKIVVDPDTGRVTGF